VIQTLEAKNMNSETFLEQMRVAVQAPVYSVQQVALREARPEPIRRAASNVTLFTLGTTESARAGRSKDREVPKDINNDNDNNAYPHQGKKG
jgi:hypothetical protein